MEDGTQAKTFENCILRPGLCLGTLMQRDAVWWTLLKVKPKMTVASIVKKQVLVRFQAPVTAALVRCLRDNSRFISVAEPMKEFSPTLYKLMTNLCKVDNTKQNGANFIIKVQELSKDFPIVTNTAVMMAILSYLYVLDRKHTAFVITKETTVEEVLEKTYKGSKTDYEKVIESMNISCDQSTEWLRVVNPCREKMLSIETVNGPKKDKTTPKKKKKKAAEKDDREEIPGVLWKFQSGKSNFGDVQLQAWEDNEARWWLPGMEDPESNEPELLTLDELIHCISTLGFKSQKEEEDNYMDVEKHLAKKPSEKQRKNCLRRRMNAVKRFLIKLEDECPLFKNDDEKSSKEQEAYKRILKIHDGSEWKDILFEKKDTVKVEKKDKASGKLDKKEIKKVLASDNTGSALDTWARSTGLQFQRLCFMKAFQEIMDEKEIKWDKYDVIDDTNAKPDFNHTEGPLLQTVANSDKASRVRLYKSRIHALIDKEKDDNEAFDSSGKKIILVSLLPKLFFPGLSHKK